MEVNASPSLTANTHEDYLLKTEMLHGMLDIVGKNFHITLEFTVKSLSHTTDMDGLLTGDEEHVSGWDLVYDNGYVEIDPEKCGYTTFLGAAVPEPEQVDHISHK